MQIVVVLALMPVIIWTFMEPLSSRFSDLNAVTTSLGQILGLVGMVLFSLNLILAGKLKFLDRYFKGLDKVYANHSRLGVMAFSIILFHPLLLVVKYLSISTSTAAMFFVPFINMPITWGIISLIIMIILISLTFYKKLKYHIWKMSHRFMTIAFFFSVLHVFFIPSDVSVNNLLKYYILILSFTGLAVVIRKSFFEIFKLSRFKYIVKNINQLNENVLEIEMEPLNKKMDFNPGQFAFFNFLGKGISTESHPFSISSSSYENNIKITVKNLGDYTKLLPNLKTGASVLIDGPYGNFYYKSVPNKNQIWISGGIGITPFLSMAHDLDSDYNVDLYYSVKENKEAVHVKDLEKISQQNPNFKLNLWNADSKGYINSGLISNLSKGLGDKDIFLCGPPLFMESLKNQFIASGVDIEKIHYENFSLY